MKKEFEKKLYTNILIDIKNIYQDDKSITENYYDCWSYLNDIINIISDSASKELLNKLYDDRQYYQDKYLINKGLI